MGTAGIIGAALESGVKTATPFVLENHRAKIQKMRDEVLMKHQSAEGALDRKSRAGIVDQELAARATEGDLNRKSAEAIATTRATATRSGTPNRRIELIQYIAETKFGGDEAKAADYVEGSSKDKLLPEILSGINETQKWLSPGDDGFIPPGERAKLAKSWIDALYEDEPKSDGFDPTQDFLDILGQ